mgnify:CR=1 FL=1
MKINSQLLRKAITDNELFCFLTGQNGYEVYFSSAFMPTDAGQNKLSLTQPISKLTRCYTQNSFDISCKKRPTAKFHFIRNFGDIKFFILKQK